MGKSKNNNYRKLIVLIILIIIAILTYKYMDNKVKVKDLDSNKYINEEYAFSLEFPENWLGEYEITHNNKNLDISSKINEIEILAHINSYSKSEWKGLEFGEDIAVEYDILGENNKSIIVLLYPGDVNYNINNKESVKKYKEMIEDLKMRKYNFVWLE